MAMHRKALLGTIIVGAMLVSVACRNSQAASGQDQEKEYHKAADQNQENQEESGRDPSVYGKADRDESTHDDSVRGESTQGASVIGESTEEASTEDASKDASKDASEDASMEGASTEEETQKKPEKEKIAFDDSWEYASYSKIHSGRCWLYHADESIAGGVTVCVNAGHGTEGGESVKTRCHPDGSAKIVSGSTSAGQTMSPAIAQGMTFPDGTREAEATLSLAKLVKDRLLDAGYDVLMIRGKDDVQLDNIARTLMANHYADCHIALHYDSTESDKGAFYMSVPNVSSYREMEPVKSCWKQHHKLGDAVIKGLKKKKVSIFGDGTMAMDLTQTSYSTIPSIDLEVGDAGSDISESTQSNIAAGILEGLNLYFKESDQASGR